MKKIWEKFVNLRIWSVLGGVFRKIGSFFVAAGKLIGAVCVFIAVAIAAGVSVVAQFIARHSRAAIAVSVILILAVGTFLALFLTLPVKSVEVEGEVILLEGEEYSGGLNIKATTKAGLIHREEVVPKMISGLDPSVPGEQTATVSYKKWRIPVTVKVLALSDITLRVREGSMPEEYEPNDAFPTSGVFDLYYNDELIRSAPITRDQAPGFTTKLSRDYDTTLVYRKGLSLPYHYTVLEVIDTITPTGVLYAPQGVALSKGNALGNMRFLVKYKDGTEEYVMIYDDRIFVQEKALESRDEDYVDAVTFLYKGFEVSCPVTAYSGELLAPSEVKLILDRNVYLEGETFDYSKAHLEVLYERFPDTPVMLLSTVKDVLLVENVGDPESPVYVPYTDGTEPIVFGEAGYFYLIAQYFGVESDRLTLRVISEEDVDRVTGLTTTWNGRASGPPVKGQELEFEGAELTVEYGFGYHTQYAPLTAEMVTGYDIACAGNQTLTLTYRDGAQEFSREITVRVMDPASTDVTRILALVGWDRPTYYSSETLVIPETAYLEVEIGYGGKSNQKIYLLNNEEIEISGFTPGILDEQVLTISYGEYNVTLDHFTVVDDRTREMAYLSAPLEIYLNAGVPLDYSAIVCRIGYNIGDPEEILLSTLVDDGAEVNTYAYAKDIPGNYDMRIMYRGFMSDWITIHVLGESVPAAQSIRLDVTEAKSAYKVGDLLDLAGMKLYLKYSDNSEKDVTDVLYEGFFTFFDTSTPGNRTATLTYVCEEGAFVAGYDYSVSA